MKDGPFVGREEELALLALSLVESRSGGGRFVAIKGEPGIGKTRLVSVFAREAGKAGWRHLSGRWYEGQALLPYCGLLEALSGLEPALKRSVLREEKQLKTVLTQLLAHGPHFSMPAGGDEGLPSPFHAREALARATLTLAGRQPVCLTLDDLQHADAESLLSLEHVIRRASEAPVLIIGAFRSTEVGEGHGLQATLFGLKRDGLCLELVLQGLLERDVGQLVAAMTGREVADEFADAICHETGGNPLFVIELVRSLEEEGRLHDGRSGGRSAIRPDELRVPEGVRELVRARVNRLGDDVSDTLWAASILGQRFTFSALRAMTALDEGRLLAIVEAAIAGGLMTESRGGSGTELAFAHPLIRDALYQRGSETRRQLGHARAAQALEILYGSQSELKASEMAHHIVRAGDLVDIQQALTYCWRAGCRSIALCAYEEAIAHFRDAMRFAERSGEPETWRADILTELGFALGQTAKGEDGVDCYEEALSIYERIGATRKAANVAKKMGVLLNMLGRFEEAILYLEKALAGFGDEVSDDHSTGLAAYAIALMSSGRLGQAGTHIDRAATMARQLHHIRAQATAEEVAAVWNVWDFGDPRLARGNFQRGLKLFFRCGSMDAGARVHCDASLSLYFMGDVEGARQELEAAEEYAKKYSRTILADVWGMKVLAGVHQGDWAAADAAWEAYQSLAKDGATSAFDAVAKRGRALQLHWRGDPAKAFEVVASSQPLFNASLKAWLLLQMEREDEALPMFRMIATRLPPNGKGGLWLLFALPLLNGLRSLARLSDAGVWLDGLTRHAGYRPDWFLPSTEAGWLVLESGRRTDPLPFFAESVKSCESTGLKPLAAVARLEMAKALLHRRAAGDKPRAVRELHEALRTFAELNMKPYAAEAETLLKDARRGRPAADHSTFGLTRRELQVLQLLTEGLTNERIAGALLVSRKTAEHHVSSILSKLGVEDRTQAAVAAIERGLVRRTQQEPAD